MKKLVSLSDLAKRLNVDKSTVSRHAFKVRDQLSDLGRNHHLLSREDVSVIRQSIRDARKDGRHNRLGQFSKKS